MTALAATTATRPRSSAAAGSTRLLDTLMFATVALAPITKFYVEGANKLVLSNVVAAAFVIAFVADRVRRGDARTTRSVLVLAALFLALTAVYAAGFVPLDRAIERAQYWKALFTWLLHGSFMVCLAAHCARGGMPLLRRCVAWLVGGFVVSAGWGLVQIAALTAGFDADVMVIDRIPLLGGQGTGGIQYYGGGLYRINGLNLDTNHLGVMLCAPIALALTWFSGRARMVVTGVLFVALVLTLSRSGALALLASLMMLVIALRRTLLSARVIGAALSAVVALVLALVAFAAVRPELVDSLIFGRLDLSSKGAQTHLQLYGLVPELFAQAPLLGHGLNSFALLFSDISGGREGFGPHSYYIRLLVETGVLGTALVGVLVGWLLWRLHRIGGLAAAGLAAAIVGTLAGNAFYLTTQIIYVEVLFALAAALPVTAGVLYHRGAMTTETPLPTRSTTTSGDRVADIVPDAEFAAGPLLRSALRLWWVVALAVVVAVAIAALNTGGAKATYAASSTVYLGQPISPTGGLLNTVSAKAATAIELATGNQAVRKAAAEADVSRARVRNGLEVAAIKSPIASQLQNPPAIMKVTMRDTNRGVAETVSLTIAELLREETNAYGSQKEQDLKRQVTDYEQQVAELVQQRAAALRAAGGAAGQEALTWTILVSSINNGITSTRADLNSARAQLAVNRELEQSRILDRPSAARQNSAARRPAFVLAAFAGLVLGTLLALAIAAARRPRSV